MFYFTASTLASQLYSSNQNSKWLGEKHYAFDSLKRVSDIFGASILLIGLCPLIVATALAVKITSRGPAVYKQTRLTKGGKSFTMFKFRSMTVDAEKNGAAWAKKNDSRLTPIGKLIRKTRLDELPQLVNVLLGDMSLIGPRPERPEFAEKLEKELPQFNKRLEVKAGITGLAQTTTGYANDIESYKDKLSLDLEYISKRSLLLDVKVALKTVAVVATGHGAH